MLGRAAVWQRKGIEDEWLTERIGVRKTSVGSGGHRADTEGKIAPSGMKKGFR
jgi:hypothetical protein